MRNSLAALALAAALTSACGQNRDLADPAPLSPDLYVIAPGDVPRPGQFLRYAEPGLHGGGLDIAVTDYAPKGQGPTVHLVGVVHVADAPYYGALQRELDAFDVVLYEGVKPTEASAIEWQKQMLSKAGDAGQMQQEIAQWFGFRYQLEAIDYGRKNLVHADMSMEEFARAGGAKFGLVPDPDAPHGTEPEGRGLTESVRATWSTVRGLGRVALGQPGPLQSFARRAFAKTMGTADIGTSLDLVPGLSDLLLEKRNGVVIDTLKAHLRDTQGSIAIFYGAAHMKGLEERIEKELGYTRKGAHWLRAWAVRPPRA